MWGKSKNKNRAGEKNVITYQTCLGKLGLIVDCSVCMYAIVLLNSSNFKFEYFLETCTLCQ